MELPFKSREQYNREKLYNHVNLVSECQGAPWSTPGFWQQQFKPNSVGFLLIRNFRLRNLII